MTRQHAGRFAFVRRRDGRSVGASLAVALVVVATMVVGCTAAPEVLTLVSGAGAPLPALLDERSVPDGDGGTILLRTVVERGTLRVEGGRYVHDVAFLAYDGDQLIGRNAMVDRGVVNVTGSTVVGQPMTFTSEVIENHAFTGVRTPAGVDVAFDLAILHGEPAVVTLAYQH
ncbi:MAG: hypothetical protein R6W77_10470 [Trueperaceae bacterium]